jgi:phage/conjugal plasmid C-4 type zinc finger TraR family protein
VDGCDSGARSAEQYLLANLHNQRQRTAALDSGSPSAIECADCGEDIPDERREAVAGCTRCVDCQTKFERGI